MPLIVPRDVQRVDEQNPWPGLAAYRESDRDFFHGRDTESGALERLVLEARLTLLFGLSGLGKTSLLMAGLFPRLRTAGCLPIYVRLDHSPGAPPFGEQVTAATLHAATLGKAEAPQPTRDETLWEYFHRQDADFWSKRNRLLTPVLVFDQFEEIFTATRAREHRTRTLDELGDLIEGRAPVTVREQIERQPERVAQYHFDQHRYRIILALREEFLPDLEGLRSAIPSIIHNRMRLRPMNGRQAMAAVQVKNAAGEPLVAERLARQIVLFVADRPPDYAGRLADLEVEPALLSLLCRQLNLERIERGESQITADVMSGHSREILSSFYERSFATLPEASRAQVRAFVEDQLLTVSGHRDSAAYENACELIGEEAIQALVDHRLLRLEDRSGRPRLELTHDVLAGVVGASRASRRQREENERAERVQQEAQRELRRMRRKQIAWVSIAVVVTIAAVFGWAGFYMAKRNAEKLTASQLARTAVARLDDAPSLALLLATEAVDRAPLTEAEEALRRILARVGGRPLRGHSEGVGSVAVNENATRLTSASGDTLYVWSQRNTRFETPVSLPVDGAVGMIALDAEGRRLVNARLDGTVQLWDLSESHPGPRRLPVTVTNPLSALTLSQDGRLLALATPGDPPTVQVWKLESAPEAIPALTLSGPAEVRVLQFSPDGHHLSAGTDEAVMRWEVGADAVPDAVWQGADGVGVFLSMALSADGRWLATVDGFNTPQLWRLGPEASRTPVLTGPGPATAVALSADGWTLAAGYRDGSVLVWVVEDAIREAPEGDATCLAGATRLLGHDDLIQGLAFSPDGRWLVTASADRSARLWDLASPVAAPKAYGGGPANVRAFGLLPKTGELVTAAADGRLLRWDYRQRQLVAGLDPGVGSLPVLAVSPDGNWLAAGAEGGELLLWRLAGGGSASDSPLLSVQSEASVEVIGYSPDSRWLAWGTSDGDVFLQPLKAGALETHISLSAQESGAGIAALAIGPDSRWLAVGEKDGTLVVWDLRDPKAPPRVRSGHEERIYTLAFAPTGDGRFATASADGTVRVWQAQDAQQPRQIKVLEHTDSVRDVAFDPEGRWLATGASNGSARLYDFGGDYTYRTLAGHHASVNAVAFSPDGHWLATGSSDATLLLWDLDEPEREPVNLALGVEGDSVTNRVDDLQFTEDGRFLASLHAGEVRLWPVERKQLIALACESAARVELREAECQEFAGKIRDCASICPTPGSDH